MESLRELAERSRNDWMGAGRGMRVLTCLEVAVALNV